MTKAPADLVSIVNSDDRSSVANQSQAGPRIVWLTNIPTPYTVPVWKAIARIAHLRVVCLATSEPNRSWRVDTGDVTVDYVRALKIRLGYERVYYGFSVRLAKSLFRRHDAIVIDGWDSLAALESLVISRLMRRRVILSYWSTGETHTYQKGPVARYRRWFMRRMDAVLTPGESASSAAAAILGSADVVYQGNASVDTRIYADSIQLRSSGRDKPGHRFIFVGQLIPRKNVAALLCAFESIRVEGDTLTIVGDGPLRELVTQAAKRDDAVTYLGSLSPSDVVSVYAESDTLVLPSVREVWGLVANEALSAGLHLVISEACGAAATLRSMDGVYVCDVGVSGVAHAMAQSRQHWSGPVKDPLIWCHRPEAMAQTVWRAVASSPQSAQPLNA